MAAFFGPDSIALVKGCLSTFQSGPAVSFQKWGAYTAADDPKKGCKLQLYMKVTPKCFA